MNRVKRRNIRFFVGIYMAFLARAVLKLLKKNATQLPGKVALFFCPDFLGRVGRPSKIIAVTGTNGKTTVCNLIIDILKDHKYKVLDNKLGSNTYGGIASSLLARCNLLGNVKEEIAVFEVDERSSKRIYSYIKPTYLVCTNLFRDSITRNAHTEFIVSKIKPYIPESTKLILNADDLISGSIRENQECTYFGIGELETDVKECKNIVCDIRVCPKCKSKLEYNYLHYHHIGNSYCPNCDFKSSMANIIVTKIDFENKEITIKEDKETYEYPTISSNLFNIYNMVSIITLLRELEFSHQDLQEAFEKAYIVNTRFTEEKIEDIEIITNMAKGHNPVACTRSMDYAANSSGNKAIILTLSDLHDEIDKSENMTWLYDIDFEFLNSESIKQIVIAGVRVYDILLRLLMAGISEEKIVVSKRI